MDELAALREEVARLVGRVADLAARLAVSTAQVDTLSEHVLALTAENEQLRARNGELERENADLRERLGRNSLNSSLPPSRDPPQVRSERRQRNQQRRSGRKPGGQNGHEGQTRQLVAAGQVDVLVDHYPAACGGCHRPFAERERGELVDGEPERRQQFELPAVIVTVSEHRLHCLGCPDCGQRTRAPTPPQLAGGLLGPRLSALIVVLSVAQRVSRRGITSLCAALCGLQGLSTATVQRAIMQASDALADVHEQIAAAIAAAPVSYIDETSWRQRGQSAWIWTRVTGTLALFKVAASRARQVAVELLGELSGVLVSDRYAVYDYLPVEQRQICLVHVKRDVEAIAARDGPAGVIGAELLGWLGHVFTRWHAYRDEHHDRARLAQEIDLISYLIRGLLERATTEADPKTAATARNLLEVFPALWTFAHVDGLEPSNNTSERSLRPAVTYRKVAFGTNSDHGSTALERVLTAIETCKRQHRDPIAYLADAITAHHHGHPAPTLVPQPTDH